MRPDGPGDLFFPIRWRAARSSLGVTASMVCLRSGSTCCVLMLLNMVRNLVGILVHAASDLSCMKEGTGIRLVKNVVDMRLVAKSLVLSGSDETAPVSGSIVYWTPPNHVVLVDRAEERNFPIRFWVNHSDLRWVNSFLVRVARRLPLLLSCVLVEVRRFIRPGRVISHPVKIIRVLMRSGMGVSCLILYIAVLIA